MFGRQSTDFISEQTRIIELEFHERREQKMEADQEKRKLDWMANQERLDKAKHDIINDLKQQITQLDEEIKVIDEGHKAQIRELNEDHKEHIKKPEEDHKKRGGA
ncbi:hypothetical protein K470DRAFT_273547 [Piedraia hortae CBS 480.64]|uniref:Uncharacterized protein n=1 Tax=Piedraia hortae CBS 480.64 TaxID=1314780 RepID=A0A6A7BP82_9PEZI|nr:hypothetical protein K470DRAFT_273547 [Piedraia hortae CBS 480.64]